jgi:hypothetical protein
MILTLPALVFAAALLYFIARHEGWLDAIARWSAEGTRRPRQSGGQGRPGAPRGHPGGGDGDRLEIFEDFLSNLGRDDSDEES